MLKLGVAQLMCGRSADENRRSTADAIEGLFSAGARVVVAPELAVPGYRLDTEYLRDGAEPLDGPTVHQWQEIASDHGGYVVGGFCERDGERLFNTAVVVGRDGVLLHYRKLHLFAREKLIFARGDLGLPVARTEAGAFGVCICYDLRFVEVTRILSLGGAELICVPSAWVAGFNVGTGGSGATGDASFPGQVSGVTVQSNLNQVYIAVASVAGPSPDADSAPGFLGHSLVADPTGHLRLGPLSASDGASELVEIDLSDVRAAQRRSELITPRADRRSDVYAITYRGRTM